VIVVLVRGIEDFKQSGALIADVTRELYQASQPPANPQANPAGK